MTRAAALLTAALLAALAAAAAGEGLDAAARAAHLARAEATLEAYFRGGAAAAERRLEEDVAAFNAWLRRGEAALAAAQAPLDEERAAIARLAAEIDALDGKIDGASAEQRRSLLRMRNGLVERHNDRIAALRGRQEAFLEGARRFEAEVAARRHALEARRGAADEAAAARRRFFDEAQDERFSHELDRFLVALVEAGGDRPAAALARDIEHARRLRGELGRWAMTRQREQENGLIVVPVLFASAAAGQAKSTGVECHLIVDTGASLVTITPEVVALLGLTGRLGERVETSLVGGLAVTGRRLLLPRVVALGWEARDVPALVLPENSAGIDGLLGRSFLRRFRVTIDDGRDPPVTLEPRPR
jgi:hypothetical protein